MEVFDFFRSENLSEKRIRNSYKINGSSFECCKNIMNLEEFVQDKVRLTLEGEEMQPDKKVRISLFSELLSFNAASKISSCLFQGMFQGKPIDIVVDYGLKTLNVVSEDLALIEAFKKELEG